MPPLIALVDDDAAILALIDEVLTEEGYRTLGIGNARQAPATLAAQPPDVVVMDWHMSGISGWDFLHALRAHPATARVPVLVCSGDVPFLRAQRDVLRALGCETLYKPFDLSDLLDCIAALLPAPAPENGA